MTSLTFSGSANIARHLPEMAAARPHAPALKVPRGRTREGKIDYLTLSFAELEAEAAAWQHRLVSHGVRRGDRVLVMMRQGLPLIASVFALFATGAVPIVIDPGMGRRNFLRCVTRSRPQALLGIPLAQVLSRVFRRTFRTVTTRISARGCITARCPRHDGPPPRMVVVDSADEELAAIIFTSGSTGSPKGVCYEHRMFRAQVELIQRTFDLQPGEIDLPMLPIFALFNPALGMTTVVPEIDPRRPASVDPAKIVQAIRQERITSSFGSPTLWLKIARHCHRERIVLDSMKRILCAGAAVPPALWELMRPILSHGELHSPYGATEALPVSSITATTVRDRTAALAGAGTCVGTVLPENDLKVVALTDEPIATLADALELPSGQIGELIVAGPTVTESYDALPAATARAKIRNGDTVYHRLGDCGYHDDQDRLWFCGRAAERVETDHGLLFTEQVEPVFNSHADVRHSALIGIGERPRQRAAIVIEPRDLAALTTPAKARELGSQLRTFVRDHRYASRIAWFFFHPDFPMDMRHNAKIHRLSLARWAQAEAPGFAIDADHE